MAEIDVKEISKKVDEQFELVEMDFNERYESIDPRFIGYGKQETQKFLLTLNAEEPLGGDTIDAVLDFAASAYMDYGIEGITEGRNPLLLIGHANRAASVLPYEEIGDFYKALEKTIQKSPGFTYNQVTKDFKMVADAVFERLDPHNFNKLAGYANEIISNSQGVVTQYMGCDDKWEYVRDSFEQGMEKYFSDCSAAYNNGVSAAKVMEVKSDSELFFDGKPIALDVRNLPGKVQVGFAYVSEVGKVAWGSFDVTGINKKQEMLAGLQENREKYDSNLAAQGLGPKVTQALTEKTDTTYQRINNMCTH